MRIEAVDPEEERLHRVVVVQPVAGRPEHAGAAIVVLRLPVALVEQVVDQGGVPRPVDRLAHVAAELMLDRARVAALPVVRLLPADEVEVGEATGEVHGRLEHVVGVGDQGGEVAARQQHLGDGVLVGRDLVPPRRVVPVAAAVEVVAEREAAPAGEQPATDLQRRLALAEGAREADALRGQGIEIGRPHVAVLLPLAHDVRPKRVQADADDVHVRHGGDGSAAIHGVHRRSAGHRLL